MSGPPPKAINRLHLFPQRKRFSRSRRVLIRERSMSLALPSRTSRRSSTNHTVRCLVRDALDTVTGVDRMIVDKAYAGTLSLGLSTWPFQIDRHRICRDLWRMLRVSETFVRKRRHVPTGTVMQAGVADFNFEPLAIVTMLESQCSHLYFLAVYHLCIIGLIHIFIM